MLERPGLFKSVKDWLQRFTAKLKRAFQGIEATNQEAKAMSEYMDELQAIWDRAMVQAARNAAAGNENAAQTGGARMQVRRIEGTDRYYVQADRQVLYGNDAEAWGEQLTRFINKEIRKGQDVALSMEDGSVLLLTATTAEKGAFRNVIYENGKPRLLTEEEYQTKLNAEAHIDELVSISRDSSSRQNIVDENSVHGDFAKNGWRYRTAYFTDFDGQYYQLRISVAQGVKGNVVYNVANIKKRSFPAPSGSSDQKTGAQGRKASTGSVPQPDQNSKPKFQARDSVSVGFTMMCDSRRKKE